MRYSVVPLGQMMDALKAMLGIGCAQAKTVKLGLEFEQTTLLVPHRHWVMIFEKNGSIKLEPVYDAMPMDIAGVATFTGSHGLKTWKQIWLEGGSIFAQAVSYGQIKIDPLQMTKEEVVALFYDQDRSLVGFGEHELVRAFEAIGQHIDNFAL